MPQVPTRQDSRACGVRREESPDPANGFFEQAEEELSA